MEKTTSIEARYSIFLVVVILLVLQFSYVSAADFDNIKTEKLITFDGLTKDDIPLLEIYKPIEITNWLGLGETLFEGYISEHTETCANDCESIMKINLTNDGSLVDNIIFKTLQAESWVEQEIKHYQLYIGTDKKEIIVNDYEWRCTLGQILKNGTTIQDCSNAKVGEHIEYEYTWNEYNLGDNVKAGEYTLKLTGEKKAERIVDWIINTNGEWLNSWATWGDASINDSSLVLHYNMDEAAGNILDSKGTYDGTNNGADYGADGIIVDGLGFIAENSDDVDLGTGMNITEEITFNAWIYRNSTGDEFIIGKWTWEAPSPDERSWALQIYNSEHLRFYISSDGTDAGSTYAESATTLGAEEWYMVTGTFDGSNIKLYINGVLNGTTAKSSEIYGGTTTGTFIGIQNGGGTEYSHFNGTMDEVSIWNESLSSTDIETLYNSGIGTTYPFNVGTVTLNSPEDTYNSTTQSNTYNATASIVGATLVNMSLWSNNSGVWSRNYFITSCVGETDYTKEFVFTIADGGYVWNVEACDSDGDCGFAPSNYTINIDSVFPQIDVEYPTGTIGYGEAGEDETLNITFTDTNLDTCWYNYNGVNYTINGCSTGVKNSTTFTIVADETEITAYSNDSSGNLNSTTISWNYNLTGISQTYPTTSVESASETYTSTLSYNSTKFNIITGSLYVNGTSYAGIRTGAGHSAIFTSSATMPSVDEETNFSTNWVISLTDAGGTITYNLSSHNVTVGAINLSLCDAVNTVPFWNFTVLNESNAVEMNSTFEGTFIVSATGSSETNEFYYSDLNENVSQYDFCISPGAESYTVNTNIKLTKVDFVDKFYNFEEIAVTNSTREDNLYMLLSTESTSFIIHVVDVSARDITEAEVRILRYYPGSGLWAVTEIVTTNEGGEAIGHLLSEDVDYKFQVYQSGVSTYNSTATKIVCSVAPCTVTLVIPISVATGIETVEDLTSTLTYSSTTNTFTYTYSDSDTSFNSARLNVIRVFPSNATIVTPCNETKTTSSGVITCDISGLVNGTYRGSGYITRSSVEFLNLRIDGILGTNIYNSMGDDGVLWVMFLFIGIAMLGIARPSLAIIFGTIGLFVVGLLGIVNIGAISLVAVSAIAIILLIRVGRE